MDPVSAKGKRTLFCIVAIAVALEAWSGYLFARHVDWELIPLAVVEIFFTIGFATFLYFGFPWGRPLMGGMLSMVAGAAFLMGLLKDYAALRTPFFVIAGAAAATSILVFAAVGLKEFRVERAR